MNVRRYFESLSEPNDTMYVEIGDIHRFTRRGDDWVKFREDLIQLLEQTISEELSKAFDGSDRRLDFGGLVFLFRIMWVNSVNKTDILFDNVPLWERRCRIYFCVTSAAMSSGN